LDEHDPEYFGLDGLALTCHMRAVSLAGRIARSAERARVRVGSLAVFQIFLGDLFPVFPSVRDEQQRQAKLPKANPNQITDINDFASSEMFCQ
jgi:hypothetical protein